VYCVRKKSDISQQEFNDYWLNQHGPLVDSQADVLSMKRYVQSHSILPEVGGAIAEQRGMQPGYDGITEVWYESVEVAMAAISAAEGVIANGKLAEDEAKFIDIAASTLFITEEHLIFDK
jgi:uncharacterized protein (TIGR02118 family)